MPKSAASAQEFWEAEKAAQIHNRPNEPRDHQDYMDFAERYADWMCEFERHGSAPLPFRKS